MSPSVGTSNCDSLYVLVYSLVSVCMCVKLYIHLSRREATSRTSRWTGTERVRLMDSILVRFSRSPFSVRPSVRSPVCSVSAYRSARLSVSRCVCKCSPGLPLPPPPFLSHWSAWLCVRLSVAAIVPTELICQRIKQSQEYISVDETSAEIPKE